MTHKHSDERFRLNCFFFFSLFWRRHLFYRSYSIRLLNHGIISYSFLCCCMTRVQEVLIRSFSISDYFILSLNVMQNSTSLSTNLLSLLSTSTMKLLDSPAGCWEKQGLRHQNRVKLLTALPLKFYLSLKSYSLNNHDWGQQGMNGFLHHLVVLVWFSCRFSSFTCFSQ